MFIRLSVLLSAIAIAMTTFAVHAQPDPAELHCGATSRSTEEVERCLKEALAQAEQKLALAQEQAQRALRQAQPRFEQLKDATLAAIELAMSKAQEAWRKFRDSNCNYYGNLHEAIGEDRMEQLACQLKMVRARTEELAADAKFWAEKAPAKER
jgi:uncharacterized protein YecT (DUF1311 family)